jgi:hypothetical protein
MRLRSTRLSEGAVFTGDPADFFTAAGRSIPALRRRAGSSSAANRTFDANGNIIPFSTNGPAGDGVGATGFNRSVPHHRHPDRALPAGRQG